MTRNEFLNEVLDFDDLALFCEDCGVEFRPVSDDFYACYNAVLNWADGQEDVWDDEDIEENDDTDITE